MPSAPIIVVRLIASCIVICFASTAWSQESYPVHPDAKFQDGVPRGKVEGFEFSESKIFPGTTRKYFVYVPNQYKPEQPAALMVFQDGEKYVRKNSTWNVPAVFDNLIHRGEMPVSIAVCVNPGVVPALGDGDVKMNRFNRSYEYDSVSAQYARFLTEELLPEVQQKYSITDDPNLRGIAGSSSGAIAAFTAAWHRPNHFRRVFSTVGTFVGLRGGNEYPTLIRKVEPKPIRVFLQDGSNDLNIYGGGWWNANLSMLTALQWAGYPVKHQWGEGGHNGKHGSAIFPDAMKWLWEDFDSPISISIANHPELKDRLIDGKGWELVTKNANSVADMIAVPGGDVLLVDSDGNVTASIDSETGEPADSSATIPANVQETIANKSIESIQFAEDNALSGIKKVVATTKTPDHRFQLVAGAHGRFIWSYAVGNDGKLRHGQPFGYVHSPQNAMSTGVSDMGMLKDGFVCVSTKMGLQILDQPGRVHVILPAPTPNGAIAQFAFGGKEFSMLYIKANGSIYRRPTKMTGVYQWMDPVAPPKPRL